MKLRPQPATQGRGSRFPLLPFAVGYPALYSGSLRTFGGYPQKHGHLTLAGSGEVETDAHAAFRGTWEGGKGSGARGFRVGRGRDMLGGGSTGLVRRFSSLTESQPLRHGILHLPQLVWREARQSLGALHGWNREQSLDVEGARPQPSHLERHLQHNPSPAAPV